MNNLLFSVSAAVFQKNLEKEANSRDREEFGELDLKTEEIRPSDSALRLLMNKLGRTKATHQVVAPKFKNKAA